MDRTELFERGMLHQIHGDAATAINYYNELLEAEEDHPRALLNLGLIFFESRRPETAEQVWRRALASDALDALTAHLLSLGLTKAGVSDLARAAARKALELDPLNAAYAYSLGAIYANGGLLYQAREFFERAVELAPDNVEILKGLGAFCISEFIYADRGIEVMKRTLELQPGDKSARSLLGQLYWVNLQFDRAAEVFQAIYDEGSADVLTRFRLAMSLLRSGKRGRSRDKFKDLLVHCDSLLDVTDDVRHMIRQLGFKARVEMAAGDRQAAIATLEKARGMPEFTEMDFRDGGYLPDHMQRIDRLRRIVAGRDLAIMGHGPSLERLEPYLDRLSPHDICYVGMNRFGLTEDHLLKPMGRDHEIIAVTPPQAINDMLPHVREFLLRDRENLLYTSAPTLDALMAPNPDRRALEKVFGGKLLYYDARFHSPPTLVDPLHFIASNTLSVTLPLAIIAKPRRIFLLGADGYLPDSNGGDTHFRRASDSFAYSEPGDHMARFDFVLKADTLEFNDAWDINAEATRVLYGVNIPPIYNVNPDSTVAVGEKISVETFLETLESPV